MASFATPSDLATFLRETVDTAAAQQALDLATARIKARTGQTFTVVTGDVVVLEGGDWLLRLPQRPVTAVTLVETSNGYAPLTYTTAALGTQYRVLGSELTWLGRGLTSPGYVWPAQVRVTYSHGYATLPDDIRECCLVLAQDRYSNPAGLTSETVDDYTWRGQTSEKAAAEQLLDEVVRRYRVRAGSVVLR